METPHRLGFSYMQTGSHSGSHAWRLCLGVTPTATSTLLLLSDYYYYYYYYSYYYYSLYYTATTATSSTPPRLHEARRGRGNSA